MSQGPHPPSTISTTTDGKTPPDTIIDLRFLGRREPTGDGTYPTAVYYLTYRSSTCGGVALAAKAFVPVGDPPASGWPASVWSHGLGDPATQLRRWPLAKGDWRVTRGELAGRWADHGILTLCPWLPGDGPSEPLGTYSPLSLERNAQAIADAFLALGQLEERMARFAPDDRDAPIAARIDANRLVLRTDCVSTPLLVHFAAHWRAYSGTQGLGALVADDLQPSIAYNESYLGPYLCDLEPLAAAAMRCVWMRLIWALALERGWPLSVFFSPRAIDVLGREVDTPVGRLGRIMGTQLVPPQRSTAGPAIAVAAKQDLGRSPNGREIRDWIYSPAMAGMASEKCLADLVSNEFYEQYFAPSDPFFAQTIEPFAPGLPLLVVPRTGENAINVRGLPNFDARFQNMTAPKIKTLRSWGWDIEICPPASRRGTSFSGDSAQRWVLDRLGTMT